MRFLIVLAFFASWFPSGAFAQKDLESLASDINARIDAEDLVLKKISKDLLTEWLNDAQPFLFFKENRRKIASALEHGELAAGFSIEIQQMGIPDFPDRIVLNPLNAIIVSGTEVQFNSAYMQRVCEEDERYCVEDFRSPLPSAANTVFPADVKTRIGRTEVPGDCLLGRRCERDHLAIELLVDQVNVEKIVRYFAVGFSPVELEANLRSALGQQESAWVRLESVLHGWSQEKIGTFPLEDDNEVCHGPARQFFNSKLQNGRYDRSTEATESLLRRYYCPVADQAEPAFGDYLYVPASHSGRFVMKDPATQRWISFSVYSGGAAPYRFWWTDEDFSGRPFDHKPLKNFREKHVDLWRRCR